MLRVLAPEAITPLELNPVDDATLAVASSIVHDVQTAGESALRRYAERFGDVQPHAPLVIARAELQAALESVGAPTRSLLERVAQRIRAFAAAQRAALREIDIPVPGGRAGHTVTPVDTAGCYAPGGRFPLPSSVLMTAVTARAAGVRNVIVASPKPTVITLAAAAVAEADCLLAVGGAQAVAAMAYGVTVPRCDIIVGPGNRWVTAAKQIVAGTVAIDMLAGPSELVVVADDTANPAVVAADLLAQAEHDPDALPILIAFTPAQVEAVNRELATQLTTLSTRDIAAAALQKGFAAIVPDYDEAIALCDRLAPEHLALHVENAATWRARLRHYGALFIGGAAAEVFGDYGVGPNHVLPTGGAARAFGGLSVFNFLRVRTWLEMIPTVPLQDLVTDTAALARLEGLEAHARSALHRGH